MDQVVECECRKESLVLLKLLAFFSYLPNIFSYRNFLYRKSCKVCNSEFHTFVLAPMPTSTNNRVAKLMRYNVKNVVLSRAHVIDFKWITYHRKNIVN